MDISERHLFKEMLLIITITSLRKSLANCLKIMKIPRNIHLDLTHGINYSTILTYRAIKEITELFSIFKEIKFKVYSSDPSLPTIANKLSINIIEDLLPSTYTTY